MLFITVCTLRQLPQAFVLGNSIRQLHPDARFQIGLADEAGPLDPSMLPYPILPVGEVMDESMLASLSAQYTPTEFVAAVKPSLIRAILTRHPDATPVIYLDPNTFLYAPLTPVLNELKTAQVLLTPHLIQPPADGHQPDEKFLQNIGLYSADFLALKPTAETDRMLKWWENRVLTRARIDFCESLCLDQIWLMHLPAMFEGVRIVQDQTWHRAIWNWHERNPQEVHPPLWINFKGLYNPDEGLFIYQSRLKPDQHPGLKQWLSSYRLTVKEQQKPVFDQQLAFGQQPEQPVIRGWRRHSANLLRSVTRFVEEVALPVIR